MSSESEREHMRALVRLLVNAGEMTPTARRLIEQVLDKYAEREAKTNEQHS
jgi:polyhydroxyalkanoate synthesis regulator phasin